MWLWEEDVKLGKLGQFLEEERGRNPGSKMRMTPLRMWKKPTEGEDEEKMEEKGEVEREDDAGGPSRIGEALNFLSSGFSKWGLSSPGREQRKALWCPQVAHHPWRTTTLVKSCLWPTIKG